MKIAIISDIHGNIDALEAVMVDIEEQKCDKVFVLGDYAMAGPNPGAVVDWFFKKQLDKNYIMIQGNTDSMIVNYTDSLYEELRNKAPIMAEALKDDARILNSIQKDFLKNLPAQVETIEEGIKILLVHGSPRRNNEDIMPDISLETLDEILKGVDSDVVLCGHTHLPCGFQTKEKKTVVNVGSVGRPFTENAKPCYLKLTINNGKCIFEHRFIDYNNDKAAKTLSKRAFKGAEKLAEMLINPTIRHF